MVRVCACAVCVCACVCVCERERDSLCVCVCKREGVRAGGAQPARRQSGKPSTPKQVMTWSEFVPALDTGCMCLTPFCNEVEWCVLPTRLNGMKKMEKKEENRDMPGRHFRVRSREVVAGRVGVYAFLGIEG